MEKVLQTLEKVEESLPAKLLADAEIARAFEPHPVRRLRHLAPPDENRQHRDLLSQRPAGLLVDPGLLVAIEPAQAAKEREALDAEEILGQLVVEHREGLLQRIPVAVGHQEGPGHGGTLAAFSQDSALKELTDKIEEAYGEDRSFCRPLCLSSEGDPEPVDDDPLLDLIRQIQAGIRVEENFEKLFRKFRPLIHSFFLRKGFSAEESKDLTQDVFFRVFKGIDTFRGESRFERWLWEIAGKIYLNELRRRKTEKRHGIEQSLDARTESGDESNPPLEIRAPDLSPEELLLYRQGLSALRSAFKQLPDQMRRCCILRYEKGLKYQEIAVLMKISIETVKAHLHQARKRLMALLGGNS